MALRFRRSIRLAPGLRMNLSGSGASLSVGPRGASVSFGRRGTFLNTGIPGSGLHARERIGAPSTPKRNPSTPRGGAENEVSIRVRVTVEDDGTVRFLDADGNPLSAEWVNRAKRQMGDSIRDLIERCCDEINAKVEALGTIHIYTPHPDDRIRYEQQEFRQPPSRPALRPYTFLARFFKRIRARIDAENKERIARYERALKAWEAEKADFDAAEAKRKELLEELVFTNVNVMEDLLEQALQAIEWPRETTVSAEVAQTGKQVLLDVDLPEIEDMPTKTASVPSKGYKLTVKEMSATKLQKLYMEHVHAIGFRIIGETFAVLPTVQQVVLSAFSQRANKATGVISDEYLYSVRVNRADWAKINFRNLIGLDVVSALEQFELRRDITKTGQFRPIEPFAATSV